MTMTPRKAGEGRQIDRAEAMAIDALGWLAGETDRLERFVALSGLGPDNLRDAAATPGFFAAILDYLTANEKLLMAFAVETRRRPEEVARAALTLGDPPLSQP